MNEQDHNDLLKRIDLGVRRGAARALAEYKKAGRSIVVWRDGYIMHIPPDEIKVPNIPLDN